MRERFFCELDTVTRRQTLTHPVGTAHRHEPGVCTECDRERAMLARFDEYAVALPRDHQAPPITTTPIPRSHDDQEDTMNPAIDAEGVAEKAAHLRSLGWHKAAEDPDHLWRHPACPALPALTLDAALELARAAERLAPERRDPAEPPRHH